MKLIKYINNTIKGIFNKNIVTKEKEKLMILFKEILELSYYDEKSNTLVINSPTNLVISTSGSHMTISNGFKIDIAEKIHLNPILPINSKININKNEVSLTDVLLTFESAIKE